MSVTNVYEWRKKDLAQRVLKGEDWDAATQLAENILRMDSWRRQGPADLYGQRAPSDLEMRQEVRRAINAGEDGGLLELIDAEIKALDLNRSLESTPVYERGGYANLISQLSLFKGILRRERLRDQDGY